MNRHERRLAGKHSCAPPSADSAIHAALAHHEAGRLAQACRQYRIALRMAPDAADLHYNLGLALFQMGQIEDAVSAWRDALSHRPDYPAAHNNLAIALADLFALDEAEQILLASLSQRPDIAETHNNLAIIQWYQGRWRDAEQACRQALALRSDYPDAFNTLGIILADLGRLDDAVAAYEAAIRLAPEFAKAHFNLALALLTRGDLARGWREHEWRWKGGARRLSPRSFATPQWQGESLAGRTILIHAEQGYGDTLQFVRFLPALVALGARVILEAPQPLVRLFGSIAGLAAIIATGTKAPPFDIHCPLMSLPALFGTTLASLPADMPYLVAPSDARRLWRQRLDDRPGRKIGLVWAGDPRRYDPKATAIDARRSVALSRFAPLLARRDIDFVSLQKGSPREQLTGLDAATPLWDPTGEIDDFADMAALVAELDLIITVDTAMAHLAGALGKPVWILSRHDACWRWLRDRTDSPWYPTARLFRQPEPGNWDAVIEEVMAALSGIDIDQ